MASQPYSSPTFFAGFAAGVFLLFVLGVATERDIRYIGTSAPRANTEIDESAADHVAGMKAALMVGDQESGSTVRVVSAEFAVPGWIVVHETQGGHVLNALGAARVDSGIHTDAVVELLRGTEPGGSYAVILYSDNGNKEFEIRGDLPIIDTEGNPVMKTFRTYGGAAGQ
ncbi:MAG: hypothetical protein HYT30_00660 [Parcubacteria group bacterium]|nr:hypothetical protein [Parcubacteria group bacterium]